MSTIHACYQPEKAIDLKLMEKMVSASDYWQPDAIGNGFNESRNCGFAKASLFNTPLSRQDNVFSDPATGLMITANARIDNRLALAKQLELDNGVLSQLPDNQLILKAYQRWGEDCPGRLLGDFAFIIWDEVRQRLFSARDHFGVKLLMYSQTAQGLMLSNEPNAFFTSQWLKPVVKESWLVDFIWNLGPTPVATAYHHLEVLPAAHTLSFDGKQLTIQRYWSLQDNKQWQPEDDETLLGLLKTRFQQAVAHRLISDYPLSSELSEGLDSNGVAGFAAKLKPEQTIHTLSYQCVRLTDKTRSVWEKTYQDIFAMLAMHNNLQPVWTEHCFAESEKQRYIANIGGAFDSRGGNLWHCQLASQKGARVILSGWGGDHCVTSYGDFYDSELWSGLRFGKLHKLIKDQYKRGRGGHPLKSWLHLALKHLCPSFYCYYLRRRNSLENALWTRSKFSFLQPQLIGQYRCQQRLKNFIDHYRRKNVKAHHDRELFELGLEQRLIDSELSARQYRMEFRFPMLDIPLVELAYNLPSHLKCYQGIERYPFRRVLQGVTTERIQWRCKADVDLPNKERLPPLSDEEQQTLQELLASEPLRSYCQPIDFNQQDKQAAFMFKQLQSFAANYEYFVKNSVSVEK